MIIWFLFALLAALTVALVIWPLASASGRAPGRAEYDKAVYRDQLNEVARDAERGVLTPAEAASARLEVERRLLAAAEDSEPSPQPVGGRARRVLTAAIAVVVPIAAVAAYLVHGAPRLPDQPYDARAEERALTNANGGLDLEKAIAALKERLKADPQSSQGWLLLARTEAARSHWQESADAYRQALALTHDRPEIAAAYAETLVVSAGGTVTPAAKQVLDTVIAHDPGNPSARFYLALAQAQAGDTQAAIDAWQKLLAEAPADAPWAQMVRQRIADTAKAAGLPVPPTPPTPAATGPTADDVAAAAQLSPEQRNEMVRGMVERLAARLKDAPDDLKGWLRLGRAYEVLKDPVRAADAYAHAAKLKPGDSAILAHEIDAMMADHASTDPIPPAAVAVLKQLQALDANEPRALWYLGLAAMQAHQPEEAKAYWRKLLGMLVPGTEEHKTVSDALSALSN